MFGRKQRLIELLRQDIDGKSERIDRLLRTLTVVEEKERVRKNQAEKVALELADDLEVRVKFLRGEPMETREEYVERTRPDRPYFPDPTTSPQYLYGADGGSV